MTDIQNLNTEKGRKKGSKNKFTKFHKATIQKILDDYVDVGMFMDDFARIEPLQRLTLAEKFFQYIAPKMQSTSLELTTTNDKNIEQKLKELVQNNNQTNTE